MKTLLKFEMEGCKDATKALTDLVYNLRDIEHFYVDFLTYLNDQKTTVTAGTTVRNLNHLIFQIQTYVLPGIDNIKDTAHAIGHFFGHPNTHVFETFAETSERGFRKMAKQLKKLSHDFHKVEHHLEITKLNLLSVVDTEVLDKIIIIARDLTQNNLNLDTVVAGFTVVTETIETASDSMYKFQADTIDAYSQELRTFSLTVTNSKKRFTARTDINIMSIVVSLADFETVLANAKTLIGSRRLGDHRDIVREYYTNISAVLFADNTYYQTMLSEYEEKLSKEIYEARKDNDKDFEEFLEDVVNMAAKSRGSAARCFSPDSPGMTEIEQIMTYYRESALKCIEGQINVTIQSQTLKTFINEDVVLNWMGAADELCGCIKQGDKQVSDETKHCVHHVSKFYSIYCHQFANEQTQLISTQVVEKIEHALVDDTLYVFKESEDLDKRLHRARKIYHKCHEVVSRARHDLVKRTLAALLACSAN